MLSSNLLLPVEHIQIGSPSGVARQVVPGVSLVKFPYNLELSSYRINYWYQLLTIEQIFHRWKPIWNLLIVAMHAVDCYVGGGSEQ
jgi:hypothetical protein